MHQERNFMLEYTGCQLTQYRTHRKWSKRHENQRRIKQGNGLHRCRIRESLLLQEQLWLFFFNIPFEIVCLLYTWMLTFCVYSNSIVTIKLKYHEYRRYMCHIVNFEFSGWVKIQIYNMTNSCHIVIFVFTPTQ